MPTSLSSGMKTTLLLLALVGLAFSVVIKQQARKTGSLHAKLMKEGRYADFLAKQHLARIESAGSNSAVASQPFIDTSDYYYTGDIGLGTPYQNFTVVLDTGSSTTWVIDAACTAPDCVGYLASGYLKHRFDTSQSSTFVKTSQTFVIDYGAPTGKCTGNIATDVLNLAGLVYPTQGLGVATSIPEPFGEEPIDGYLGLGWPALAVNDVVPPIQNLLDQLDQPLFTIWLDRHVTAYETALGGLITYGGLDGVNCDAQIDYVTLSSKTYWQFPMTSFSVGSYSANAKQEVISDTGTPWIGAPTDAVAGIIKAIGAKYDWMNQVYTIPCKGTYPDMIFTIGGKSYNVPSSEYVIDLWHDHLGTCVVTISELAGGGFGPTWVLGDTWIRTYCNVHDVGQGRIGFAKAHHTEI